MASFCYPTLLETISGYEGNDNVFIERAGTRGNSYGLTKALLEIALDDLKFLFKIAQKYEPGSYRASGTICDLEKLTSGIREKGWVIGLANRADTDEITGFYDGSVSRWTTDYKRAKMFETLEMAEVAASVLRVCCPNNADLITVLRFNPISGIIWWD